MATIQSLADAKTRTYAVTGMTCGSCEVRVKTALEVLPEVGSATADKATRTAEVRLQVPVSVSYLQQALGDRYRISLPEAPPAPSAPTQRIARPAPRTPSAPPERSWLQTYRPLLTIVGLIAVVTVLAQAPLLYSGDPTPPSRTGLDATLWMRHFMAGFLIVFAGFKLLDVAGFSESYAVYDIVAKRWRGWGRVYPFVELGLGLAYLTDVAPVWTNVTTIIVLGVSTIGVVQGVLGERAIECACLGTGFELPMSTVTIIEDVGMVIMAAAMLTAIL